MRAQLSSRRIREQLNYLLEVSTVVLLSKVNYKSSRNLETKVDDISSGI